MFQFNLKFKQNKLKLKITDNRSINRNFTIGYFRLTDRLTEPKKNLKNKKMEIPVSKQNK
jgi:hypothetical protein